MGHRGAAGIAIGALTGRGRLFVEDHAQRYEDAVDAGETLVSVPEEGTAEAA